MNIAIIIAAGSGSRMRQDIPKQFIHVYDKPVLFYTMEGFQKHPLIDAIEVVCLSGWENMVWAVHPQRRLPSGRDRRPERHRCDPRWHPSPD